LHHADHTSTNNNNLQTKISCNDEYIIALYLIPYKNTLNKIKERSVNGIYEINYQGMIIMLKNCGFTLVELLTTLVIVTVLSMAAIPSFKHIYQASKATAVINQVVGVTRLARNTAVTEKTTTTLCPSIDGVTCSDEWKDGVILFTDNNTNSQIDGNDHVVRFYQPFIDTGFLNWRSLRNKIQFSSTGLPRGTIGSFVYCPKSQDPLYAKSMILSFQGRIRSGQDRNQDGIDETSSGQNISCS